MARAVRGDRRLDTGILIACVVLAVFGLVMKPGLRDRVSAALRATVLSPFVALESRAAAVRATIESRSDVLNTRGQVAVEISEILTQLGPALHP